jgi:hypothetical protein
MRGSLSKTVRFEVFKRDSFTCQYCARKAPDVLLQIDHIEPVAKGGTNDLLNLTTACKDCNSGKSDKRLSESTVLDKRRAQLEELQERREQIDMMFQWQKGLLELQDEVVDRLQVIWAEQVPGYTLNESGLRGLRKLAKTYSVDEIVTAIRVAADQYLVFRDGKPAMDSVEHAWKKVGGICRMNRLERKTPGINRLYYIRGILRNRLFYCNEQQAMGLLRKALELDASLASLEELAKSAKNWTAWRAEMEDYISEHESESTPDRDTQDGS